MKNKENLVIDLIERAKQGDQIAFSGLLNNFWNDVYNFQLNRNQNENEAEDITIRTFSKAFDKIATFDPDYSFKTWLFTISKNLHIDLIRKKKANVLGDVAAKSLVEEFKIVDDSPTIEDQIIIEQNLTTLLSKIKQLKPHYQKVINLRYFNEMSYIEIAKELNEPVNNIKVKLLRAKKLLAEILKTDS